MTAFQSNSDEGTFPSKAQLIEWLQLRSGASLTLGSDPLRVLSNAFILKEETEEEMEEEEGGGGRRSPTANQRNDHRQTQSAPYIH